MSKETKKVVFNGIVDVKIGETENKYGVKFLCEKHEDSKILTATLPNKEADLMIDAGRVGEVK